MDHGDAKYRGHRCAYRYKGAWWYIPHHCLRCQLTGLYLYGHHMGWKSVIWYTWTGHTYSLKFAEMKIRPNHAWIWRHPVLTGTDMRTWCNWNNKTTIIITAWKSPLSSCFITMNRPIGWVFIVHIRQQTLNRSDYRHPHLTIFVLVAVADGVAQRWTLVGSGPSMGRVGLGRKILRLAWVGLDSVQCQKYLINIQFIYARNSSTINSNDKPF